MRDKAYACSPPTTYLTRQLETVDGRHVDVHQHYVGQTRLDFAYGLRSAVRDRNIVATQPQKLGQRIRHIINVIDNEDLGQGSSPWETRCTSGKYWPTRPQRRMVLLPKI